MSICEDIKKRYIRLSKGQRKVAQFVIDNPNIAATHIASEVGRLADVSESTVIRFCYAMDLSGFSELQDKVKGYLMEKGEMPVIQKKSPAKKVKKLLGEEIVKKDIDSISQTFNQLNEQDVENVVRMLHSAGKIHLLGFRHSAPAAFWMYNHLKTLRDDVNLIQHEADRVAQQLAVMDENSVLLIISLDREYEDIATIVDIAKRKNVKVVAIRDKKMTAMPEPAHKVLLVPTALDGGATATIAVFSLLHILVESMVSQNPPQYKEYQRKWQETGAQNLSGLTAIS